MEANFIQTCNRLPFLNRLPRARFFTVRFFSARLFSAVSAHIGPHISLQRRSFMNSAVHFVSCTISVTRNKQTLFLQALLLGCVVVPSGCMCAQIWLVLCACALQPDSYVRCALPHEPNTFSQVAAKLCACMPPEGMCAHIWWFSLACALQPDSYVRLTHIPPHIPRTYEKHPESGLAQALPIWP